MKPGKWYALALSVFMVHSAWPAYYYYKGTVAEATGTMSTLTPPGTVVRSIFEISNGAVQYGEATSSDVLLVGLRFGDFCFGHHDDCNQTGALVPFLLYSDNLIQFDKVGNVEGGTLDGDGFSPVFGVPIPIQIDFEQGSITVGQGQLGVAVSIGDIVPVKPVDIDADGLFDQLDNCQFVSNSNQADHDSDGFGNFCDPDFDNNCVVNFHDLVRLAGEFSTFNDKIDLTGDGYISFSDVEVLKNHFFLAPGPSGHAACP